MTNIGTFKITSETIKEYHYKNKIKKYKYLTLECNICEYKRKGTFNKLKKVINCEHCLLKKEFVGNTYGNLTVNYLEGNITKEMILNCTCTCGNNFDVKRVNFICTKPTSCNSCSWTTFNYNHNLFKELSLPSKYILGFLYSDGNLTKNRNSFSITQHKNEEYLLRIISSYIRKEYTVINLKGTNLNRIVFNHENMYNDLLNWGLYPNKSSTLKINDKLLLSKSFWRGMIDGDGCINISSKNRFRLIMYGTEDICKGFKSFCEHILNKNLTNNVLEDKRNYSFKFCSFTVLSKNALEVLKSVYENKNDLYMERKYNKYINYLNNQL